MSGTIEPANLHDGDFDYECVKCSQSFFTASALAHYEFPEHGLCWPCSSDEVTRLRRCIAGVIEVLEADDVFIASKDYDAIYDALDIK